jgi:hypothetical protein
MTSISLGPPRRLLTSRAIWAFKPYRAWQVLGAVSLYGGRGEGIGASGI